MSCLILSVDGIVHLELQQREIEIMIIRKLRLQRGWSQEQLATMSGLSNRTIQRIERGQSPSLESLKSLAAVFEIDLNELQQADDMTYTTDSAALNNTTNSATAQQVNEPMHNGQYFGSARLSIEEQQAIEYVKDIKAFYSHAATFMIVIPCLFMLNYITLGTISWAFWPLLGWGIGLLCHGLSTFEVFSVFDAKWERKQIEKKLGRKL